MSSNHQAEKQSAIVASADTTIQDLPPQEGSSDGEGGERTAREKLKKTSIAGLSQYSKVGAHDGDHPLGEVSNTDTISDAQPENGQARGRPSKKRSFDDLQNEETGTGVENGGPPLPKKGTQHKRMRSRELSGDDAEAQSLDQTEDMASPVQEEIGADAQQSPGGPGVLVSAPSQAEMDAVATVTAPDEENATAVDTLPELARGSDQGPATSATGVATAPSTIQEPKSKIPASSGFANASIASPFSSFKSPKSPEIKAETVSVSPGAGTSTSAFASSGLSAFASLEKSPFGAVGASAKNSGGFGSGTTLGGFGSSSGGFGSASPFASKPASGFGSGGGFGSTGGFGSGGGFGAAVKPLGGGVSSFAGTTAGAATFSKGKPFGIKSDEDDDGSDDGGDEEEGAQQSENDAQQDPRFHQQELNTGEEDEETIFSCIAKLYHFEKEWKESGVGDFKINIRYEARSTPSQSAGTEANTGGEKTAEDDEQDLEAGEPDFSGRVERKARLIMRARGTHRLVLNTPVFKEMNVGTHDGKEPTGKTMHLTGLDEGRPTGYQMKVGKEETLKEIYQTIKNLQQEL